LHHVHRQIIELEQKQTKQSKTVNELVDEYNRHETTFSEILNSLEKLDEQKVDKVLLSTQVNDKANKDELRDKVRIFPFTEKHYRVIGNCSSVR
jgi:mRNA-degrading endonuclease HigB of HigAB toxin-antitoxin module